MTSSDWQGIAGVIFDYGGTLDTAGCHWARVIWRAYVSAGVPTDEALFREAYAYAERTLGRLPIIMPTYTFRDTLREKLCLEMSYIAGRQAGFDTSKWLVPVLDRLYEGAKEQTAHSRATLQLLAERMPLVLVSNFYGNLHTVISDYGLDGLFKAVVESAVVGVRKPSPEIFSLGVKALGLEPSSVLVVGDSYDKDIAPAKAAGCRTAWFEGEGWTQGRPADTSAADCTIGSIDELAATMPA